MTSAVVNSSPLIHLGDVGKTDLLKSLFETVEVPVAVAAETAVLSYAIAHPGVEAIIDDLAARRCAKAFSIPICGTLGLVVRAARKGIVTDPVELLTQLRDAGMWLDPRLFELVLSLAREFQ